jgi:hypothetical protein
LGINYFKKGLFANFPTRVKNSPCQRLSLPLASLFLPLALTLPLALSLSLSRAQLSLSSPGAETLAPKPFSLRPALPLIVLSLSDSLSISASLSPSEALNRRHCRRAAALAPASPGNRPEPVQQRFQRRQRLQS